MRGSYSVNATGGCEAIHILQGTSVAALLFNQEEASSLYRVAGMKRDSICELNIQVLYFEFL